MDHEAVIGVWAAIWSEGTRLHFELNYVERASPTKPWIEGKHRTNWEYEASSSQADRNFITELEGSHVSGHRADTAQMVRQAFMISLQNAVQTWEGSSPAAGSATAPPAGRKRRD